MSEHWEKIIEYEIEFFVNIDEYESRLREWYYESQLIQYPVAVYDEGTGQIYHRCPGTEAQALSRIESKELLESRLKQADKRWKRLNNAFKQLTDKEINLVSFLYFEETKHIPKSIAAGVLGYSTVRNMMTAKERILKKLFAIYEKDRRELHLERSRAYRNEIRRNILGLEDTEASNA